MHPIDPSLYPAALWSGQNTALMIGIVALAILGWVAIGYKTGRAQLIRLTLVALFYVTLAALALAYFRPGLSAAGVPFG